VNPVAAMLLWFGVPAVVALAFLGGVGVGLRLAQVTDENRAAAMRERERIQAGNEWPDDATEGFL
jgi:hypothetical protein